MGNFTERVRLIASDGETQLRESKVKFTLEDGTHNATNASVFGQLQFQAAGAYYVEVEVDDVMKLRYALPIIEVPPQESTRESGAPSKED
jgi:hypothetical protein